MRHFKFKLRRHKLEAQFLLSESVQPIPFRDGYGDMITCIPLRPNHYTVIATSATCTAYRFPQAAAVRSAATRHLALDKQFTTTLAIAKRSEFYTSGTVVRQFIKTLAPKSSLWPDPNPDHQSVFPNLADTPFTHYAITWTASTTIDIWYWYNVRLPFKPAILQARFAGHLSACNYNVCCGRYEFEFTHCRKYTSSNSLPTSSYLCLDL